MVLIVAMVVLIVIVVMCVIGADVGLAALVAKCCFLV